MTPQYVELFYRSGWMCGAIALLSKGCSLLWLSELMLPLAIIGFAIGWAKGRWVLSKTARRMIGRIPHLPQPIRLRDAVPLSYLALIGVMVGLSMALRWLPGDLRGVVDLAVGTALLFASFVTCDTAVPDRSS